MRGEYYFTIHKSYSNESLHIYESREIVVFGVKGILGNCLNHKGILGKSFKPQGYFGKK